MNRRELLGVVGLGAVGITGFVGGSADNGSQDTETTTEATTTTAGEAFEGIRSSADQPFAEIAVGTREGVRKPDNNLPHLVRVWNDADRDRTVGLTLVRDGGPALLDREFEFAADGFLTVRLLEPGNYSLEVRPGGGAAAAVEVPRARFDCNDSWTDVAVTAAGRVKSETVTTEIGCAPEVSARTFTQFRGTCGSANDAGVTFTDESVTVQGSIRAPTPCHSAELSEVSVADADTLRLTVVTTEPSTDSCVQCVGTVKYRADFQFRDQVPETVEAFHASGESSELVASVTRGGGATIRQTTTG